MIALWCKLEPVRAPDQVAQTSAMPGGQAVVRPQIQYPSKISLDVTSGLQRKAVSVVCVRSLYQNQNHAVVPGTRPSCLLVQAKERRIGGLLEKLMALVNVIKPI